MLKKISIILYLFCIFQSKLFSQNMDFKANVTETNNKYIQFNYSNFKPQIIGNVITTNAFNYNQISKDSNSLPRLSFVFCVPLDADNFQIEILKSNPDSVKINSQNSVANPESNKFIICKPVLNRGINLVTVIFNPFFNKSNYLHFIKNAQFRLSFISNSQNYNYNEPIVEHNLTEEYFSSFVLNYQESKNFRINPKKNNVNLHASQDNGLEQSLLLKTPKNAIYSITAEQIKNYSKGAFYNTKIDDIRLRSREVYYSFYVDDKNKNEIYDNDDVLFFYGKRNQENDGFYYSEITDTNIYILTFNGGDGKKELLKNISTSPQPIQNQFSQDTTLHFEKENLVFLGHSLDRNDGGDVLTIHRSDRVQSERYYWGKFSKPGDVVFNVPFVCYPTFEENSKIKVKVKLIGNSLLLPHNITFRLNDYNVPNRFFLDIYSDTTLEFNLDQNYFLNGRNNLMVIIDDTVHSKLTNELYFDFLELQGKFRLENNSNQLNLSSEMINSTFQIITKKEVQFIASNKEYAEVNFTQKGFNFQVTSRQLASSERVQPAFCLQTDDTILRTASYFVGLAASEIDYETGKIIRFETFDLYSNNTDQTANKCLDFLKSVKQGNYLIIGTSTGAGRYTKSILKNQLEILGAKKILAPDADDFVSSWIFAVRIGEANSAQEYFYSSTERPLGFGTNIFFANQNGTHFQNKFSISKTLGGDFVVSNLEQPKVSYHEKNVTLISSQADMLIISSPYFIEPANKLAIYRSEKNRVNTKVINVEDIYNEFNFGIKSPEAIRKFCDYAYKNYPSPKPAYLLLFGDASWDIANRLQSSQKVDFVPSYGHPVSDYMYGVSLEDSINFISNFFIGRLPISTNQEGYDVVNKLIEYDTLKPADWNKRFLFVAGGTSEFQVQSERVADQKFADMVLNDSYQGDTAFVHRTDKDPYLIFPTNTDAPWLRGVVNKGVLHWSFTGHGAIDRLDFDFGNAEDFDNQNRYFLVSSYSCQTGDFADPVANSKTERMITIANKGAVAAMGNTSYSYTNVDNEIKTYFYESITHNPLNRVIGNIALASKYRIFPERMELFKKKTKADSVVYYLFRNHLLCHSLMGDPSMKIITSASPELALRQQDLIIKNLEGNFPTPLDSTIVVNGKLWNFGMPVTESDTIILINATLKNSSGYEFTLTDSVRFMKREYNFSFRFPVPKVASDYTLTLISDPERKIQEEYLTDNKLIFQFKVVGNQPILLEPLSYGNVKGYSDIKIRLINPPSGSGALFWLDTTDKFNTNSTLSSQNFGKVIEEELTTEWHLSIPENLRNKKQFWWKAISIKGDSTTANLFPLVETFNVIDENDSSLTDMNFILSDSAQFEKTKIENLKNFKNGISAGQIELKLEMYSIGQVRYNNGLEIKQRRISVKLGNKELRSDNRDGINIILFDKNSATPVKDTNFVIYNGDFYKFINFVKNEIKVGQIVILAACGVSFDSLQLGSQATVLAFKDALVSLGSTYSNKLRLSDSYCLIGGKNNSIPVIESYANADSMRALGLETPYYARLDTTLSFPAQSGTVTTPVIGTATKWDKINYNFSALNPLKIEVYGYNRDNQKISLQLFNDISPLDISKINAEVFPKIELKIYFPNDTIPKLSKISVSFKPAPELALRQSTLRFLQQSVLQGDSAYIAGTIINLSSKSDALNFLTTTKVLGEFSNIEDSIRLSIKKLDSSNILLKVNTNPYIGHKSYVTEVNTGENPNENYRLNNKFIRILNSVKDTIKPEIEIYANGNRLMNGDFVSPKTKFSFKINDNSKLKMNDSLSVKLILDRDIIKANSVGAKFTQYEKMDKNLKAIFEYEKQQELESGQHELKIFVTDATQNTDTMPVAGFLEFNVSNELKLNNVVNFPNPFSNKTDFTFLIGDKKSPTLGNIKIYTLSGKKIKTILLNQSNLKIGFNKIEWNGRDDDEANLANGVYLYKLTVENENGDKQEVIDKIAIVR